MDTRYKVVNNRILYTIATTPCTTTVKPRFSISARSKADQEVEDVREKTKIVRKA